MARKQLGLTRGSIAKRIEKYDFQFELFGKAKLAPTLAERNQFILNESALAMIDNGEEIRLDELSNYKLVKRSHPVRIFEAGDGNYGGSAFTYAESAVGLNAMSADETKLFLTGQMVGSVETHETTPFAAAF